MAPLLVQFTDGFSIGRVIKRFHEHELSPALPRRRDPSVQSSEPVPESGRLRGQRMPEEVALDELLCRLQIGDHGL